MGEGKFSLEGVTGAGSDRSSPYRQTYGPVVRFKAFSSPILVLNSHRAATELLTNRGQNYSGRPFLPFLCGEVGWDRSPNFRQLGDIKLREMRNMFHRTIDGKNLDKVCI
jgi:hypothetical protein